MAEEKKERSKKDLLSSLIYQMDKTLGKGEVIFGGNLPSVPRIASTGSYKLDAILNGGPEGAIPKGKIIEIYGPNGSFKTSLALTMAAQVQKTGKMVAIADSEMSLSREYLQNLGVNPDEVILLQSNDAGEVFNFIEIAAKSPLVGLIIQDSVSSLLTKAMIEADYSDYTVGQLSRFLSSGVAKINGIVADSDCSLIFINQIRQKIGVMYGDPTTTSGGLAIGFYAGLRLQCNKKLIAGDKTDPGSYELDIKVIKSKVSRGLQTVSLVFHVGKIDENGNVGKYGIDQDKELLDLAIQEKVIIKKDKWALKYGDTLTPGEGEEKATEYFKALDSYEEIKKLTLEKIFSKVNPSNEGSFANEVSNLESDINVEEREKASVSAPTDMEEVDLS